MTRKQLKNNKEEILLERASVAPSEASEREEEEEIEDDEFLSFDVLDDWNDTV
jgi:hypothetical protein